MVERFYEQQHQSVASIDVSPLQACIDGKGRSMYRFRDEFLVNNLDTREPLQAFPGRRLPNLPNRTQFPIPDRPGEYTNRESFQEMPKYMAQWVHWEERTKAILEGRYYDVRPAHFEGIFTLVCNFMCPHCSRRTTRLNWVDGGSWNNNTPVEEANTLHPAGLRRVVDQLADSMIDGQMGIVWGGGDPTSNPFSYDGMAYARSKGITASFLTNGVFLEVDRCLDADPILIRISLNCGTEDAYRAFHGYPKGWDYFHRVKAKMRELVKAKLARNARTLIGISLIIDEKNMVDVIEAAKEIRRVVEDAGPGIDYVIVRPVMNYSHFGREYAQIKSGTRERAQTLVQPGGEVYDILKELDIPLVCVKDSFDDRPPETAHGDGSCLAYGICSEIRHNGDVQLCSDSYGNPEYQIGNLFHNSLDEIWSSQRRKQVLDRINVKKCYMINCPHNSRGHHHNRVFHQIEALRAQGRMSVVQKWVDDLRECTFDLQHSFFL